MEFGFQVCAKFTIDSLLKFSSKYPDEYHPILF